MNRKLIKQLNMEIELEVDEKSGIIFEFPISIHTDNLR